jgi:hypothetical protein
MSHVHCIELKIYQDETGILTEKQVLSEIQSYIEKGKRSEKLVISPKVSLKGLTTAIAERELLIAKYCEIEKLIGCSYVVAKNIVAKYPGAEAALEAWTILERLALDEVSDDDELIRLVTKEIL